MAFPFRRCGNCAKNWETASTGTSRLRFPKKSVRRFSRICVLESRKRCILGVLELRALTVPVDVNRGEIVKPVVDGELFVDARLNPPCRATC